MFCHYCGNRLFDDALFCNQCGKKIPQTTQQFPINTDGSAIEQSNLLSQSPAPPWSPIEQINSPSLPGTNYEPQPQTPRKSQKSLLFIIGGILAAIIIIIGIIRVAASSLASAPQVPATSTTLNTVTTIPAVLDAPTQISPTNGTVFNNYPRTTALEWNAVPGAFSYTVQVYFYQPGDTTCANGALLSTEPGISGTSYTFNFVGAQPGCWQVWAVDSTGQQGNKSSLWEFSYTQ